MSPLFIYLSHVSIRSDLLRVSCDLVSVVDDPVVEVVVLGSPAPEQVREAVDVTKLFGAEGNDTSKDLLVRQLVLEFVNGCKLYMYST